MPNYTLKIVRQRCPVIAAFRPTGEAVLIPCGKWTCPRCSRLLARKWAKRVRLHLEANEQETWWFVTLTFGSDYRTPAKAFANLKRLWDGLRKEMQRKYPGWQFMAFVEGQVKTRGGMPHFHIVSNRHPPTKRGKDGKYTKKGVHDYAVRRGFGHQAEAKPIDGQGAAWYVAKYASKGDPAMPKKFRRVRASRRWTKIPKDPEKRLIVPARGESLINFLLRASELTGREIDDLYSIWAEAQAALRRANDDGED